MLEGLYIYGVSDSKVITCNNEVTDLYICIFISLFIPIFLSIVNCKKKSCLGILTAKGICSGIKKELQSLMGSLGEPSPRRISRTYRKFFTDGKRKLRGGTIVITVPYCDHRVLPVRLSPLGSHRPSEFGFWLRTLSNFDTIYRVYYNVER